MRNTAGVKINQYENPITGLVDFVQVSFDLRVLQTEAQYVQNNPMTGTAMNVPPQTQNTPEV